MEAAWHNLGRVCLHWHGCGSSVIVIVSWKSRGKHRTFASLGHLCRSGPRNFLPCRDRCSRSFGASAQTAVQLTKPELHWSAWSQAHAPKCNEPSRQVVGREGRSASTLQPREKYWLPWLPVAGEWKVVRATLEECSIAAARMVLLCPSVCAWNWAHPSLCSTSSCPCSLVLNHDSASRWR